jgi:hypothetical protein
MPTDRILKNYQYALPGHLLTAPLKLPEVLREMHYGFPLLKVNIDFEKGEVRLEDSHISMTGIIYPARPVHLSEKESDGLVFPLKGEILKNTKAHVCSGLVIIEKCSPTVPEWCIHIYIYELESTNQEFHFLIPVYLGKLANRFN